MKPNISQIKSFSCVVTTGYSCHSFIPSIHLVAYVSLAATYYWTYIHKKIIPIVSTPNSLVQISTSQLIIKHQRKITVHLKFHPDTRISFSLWFFSLQYNFKVFFTNLIELSIHCLLFFAPSFDFVQFFGNFQAILFDLIQFTLLQSR